MPTMLVKDGSGADVYLEIDGGAGTLGDPYRIKNYVSLLNSSVPVTDNAGSLTVDDGGGSLTVDGTVAFSNTTISVSGTVAHDAADSGNPQKIGTRAEASLKTATLVADADRSDSLSDLDGQMLVKPLTTFGDIITERVTDTAGTSTAFSTFGAGGAGVRNYVTTIIVYNSSNTTGFVDIRDGAAGSVIMTVPATATGGAVINLPVPLRQPTANTALAYDVSAAITTVYISLVGFQSKL